MTVENNSAIAIDTLSDWLKDLEPVFQPMRSKTNRTLYARFLTGFEQVIARNSDWSTPLSSAVVTGRSNHFDIRFATVI